MSLILELVCWIMLVSSVTECYYKLSVISMLKCLNTLFLNLEQKLISNGVEFYKENFLGGSTWLKMFLKMIFIVVALHLTPVGLPKINESTKMKSIKEMLSACQLFMNNCLEHLPNERI